MLKRYSQELAGEKFKSRLQSAKCKAPVLAHYQVFVIIAFTGQHPVLLIFLSSDVVKSTTLLTVPQTSLQSLYTLAHLQGPTPASFLEFCPQAAGTQFALEGGELVVPGK